jgi:hypothetical protein
VVGMHRGGNAQWWECTVVGMHSGGNAQWWECTVLSTVMHNVATSQVYRRAVKTLLTLVPEQHKSQAGL